MEKGGKFKSSYSSMLQLLVLKNDSERGSAPVTPSAAAILPLIPSTSSQKRHVSPDLSVHELLPKHLNPSDFPLPRLQMPSLPPLLPDPRFSSGSGTSKESGPEDMTKSFIQNFVSDTTRLLGSQFRTLNWTQSPVVTRLMSGYFHSKSSLTN